MTDIAIVDYGMGNLRSVSKALEHVAPTASIAVTDDPGGGTEGWSCSGSRPRRDARLLA